MIPSRIQLPDGVFKITSPGSYQTTFTIKKAEERIHLESEDRKAKLEVRALRRAEARSGFHKELEKNKGAVIIGDCLLKKLATQENTLKGLSREAKNNKKRVERIKHETIEALRVLM